MTQPIPTIHLPTLLTPRLSLRAIADGDLRDLLAIHGDDEVTGFLPFPSWSGEADGLAWMARMRGLVDSGAAEQRVLQQLGNGKVLGTALLFAFDRNNKCAEVGYALGRAHWGRGYMREALVALCSHAFGALSLRRLQANIDPTNTASTGLIERMGFVREGVLRERWLDGNRVCDCAVYGLLARDWTHWRG